MKNPGAEWVWGSLLPAKLYCFSGEKIWVLFLGEQSNDLLLEFEISITCSLAEIAKEENYEKDWTPFLSVRERKEWRPGETTKSHLHLASEF